MVCGTEAPQTADLMLAIDGVEHAVTASGDGPVDACFVAVRKLVPNSARLALYQVHAVTEGTDAQATVSVRLEEDGKIATGQSADTDTVVASARAYVERAEQAAGAADEDGTRGAERLSAGSPRGGSCRHKGRAGARMVSCLRSPRGGFATAAPG